MISRIFEFLLRPILRRWQRHERETLFKDAVRCDGGEGQLRSQTPCVEFHQGPFIRQPDGRRHCVACNTDL